MIREPRELLEQLRAAGIGLKLDGDGLLVTGRRSQLTADKIAAVARLKGGLVRLLGGRSDLLDEAPPAVQARRPVESATRIRLFVPDESPATIVALPPDSAPVLALRPPPAAPASGPWPPRDRALEKWPVEYRERWGLRANALIDEGVPMWAAEHQAFLEVKAERDASPKGRPRAAKKAQSVRLVPSLPAPAETDRQEQLPWSTITRSTRR